jgi:YD repeat-containing protein
MSNTSSFSLSLASQAAPFIWGSAQDVSGMTFVSVAAPFVVSGQQKGAEYTYDNRGRLSQIEFTNGSKIMLAYDALGNRTSVIVS